MLFCRAKSRVDFACAVRDLTWNCMEGEFLPASFFLIFILDRICSGMLMIVILSEKS